ncbi:hypothetical protein Tco_1314101 [Tanacetum coccineum]
MLKQEIRSWIKKEKSSSSMAKAHTPKKLMDIDRMLDQGCVNMEILNQSTELMKSLNDINSLETMEVAQKAKLRWAIEGDENTKYYHGILNNKRSHLFIRRVFVDGEWVTDLIQVKHAFFSHFASRFEKSEQYRAHLDTQFPNVLSTDQVEELEREVPYDEVKAVVWDCWENKSRGPDGYTFEFFRSKKYNAMVLKVDFKKAYDLVRWDYLDDILYNFGLKQEDPLSPFLFILVMESLHISFSHVMQAGDWNDSNLFTIVHVLKCFFFASSLKINVSKSKLIGVKDGDCMSRSQPWDDVIRKISARLSRCKVKTLSIGVGNGVDTLFWEDVWIGDLSLKSEFPRLYALETCDDDFPVKSVRNLLDDSLLTSNGSPTR